MKLPRADADFILESFMADPAATEETEGDGVTRNSSLLPFPIVGVGASAGGLAATIRLLEATPSQPGMAFVIILHLSPEHDSHAAEILQRATKLPVLQVTRTTAIEVDRVYVIAPRLQLAMADGLLLVQESVGPRGRPVAIDTFFRTLAKAHRARAIAVVLSGTGSDGSVGLGEIKIEGGVTIAQLPDDAEYDEMPMAAVSTRQVDFVLPVTEMPAKLAELWQNARQIQLPDATLLELPVKEPADSTIAAESEASLQAIMAILTARTGSDFRHYKRGTVLRRLERRLQVTRQPDLVAYRNYLDNHPQETRQLLQDMLISVTSFFRDRAAFEAMERTIATELLGRLPLPAQLRCWVVGCATGEEAYSLAMLLADHLPSVASAVTVQIFASDIDERALTIARAGLYPEGIITDIPPLRLAHFFDKLDKGYRVKKNLREQVLFARHNILADPPFSRLDVITCRNLLMYLDRDAQAQVLELFHFALKPGGLLFLGSAETADFLSDHFTMVDKRSRIYRSNPVNRHYSDALPPRPLVEPEAHVALGAEPAGSPLAQLHRRLVSVVTPVSVLVDASGHLLHTGQGASRYLRYVEGEPSTEFLQLILPELASSLHAAMLACMQTGKSIAAKPVHGELLPMAKSSIKTKSCRDLNSW